MASNPQATAFTPFLGVMFLLLMGSCKENKNSPGVEYMPDMYRSPAVEAYVDYRFSDSLLARKPAEGTIPFDAKYLGDTYNPNLPYSYPDNTEGYEKAGEKLENPVPLTEKNLEEGKGIYVTYCDHCHGEKGEGNGPVIENGGHPPPPSFTGPLSDLPDGKAFHSITYGKGLMGSHAKQLNKKERWKVVHYVNVLQNEGENPFEGEAADTSSSEADTMDAAADTSMMDTSASAAGAEADTNEGTTSSGE